jgi:nucleoid DNA-binding protein
MNAKDLVAAVANQSGQSRSNVRAVLDALAVVAHTTVGPEVGVSLPGLGVIGARHVKGRTLRSIVDGRRVYVEAHLQATFRPAHELRAVLEAREPRLMRDPEQQRAWRLAETLVGDIALYNPSIHPTLVEETPLDQVDTLCASLFGDAWVRARARYDEQIPGAVRAVRDHLSFSARRRWA